MQLPASDLPEAVLQELNADEELYCPNNRPGALFLRHVAGADWSALKKRFPKLAWKDRQGLCMEGIAHVLVELSEVELKQSLVVHAERLVANPDMRDIDE